MDSHGGRHTSSSPLSSVPIVRVKACAAMRRRRREHDEGAHASPTLQIAPIPAPIRNHRIRTTFVIRSRLVGAPVAIADVSVTLYTYIRACLHNDEAKNNLIAMAQAVYATFTGTYSNDIQLRVVPAAAWSNITVGDEVGNDVDDVVTRSHVHTALPTHVRSNTPEQCPICYSEYDVWIKLPCSHRFCPTCWCKWDLSFHDTTNAESHPRPSLSATSAATSTTPCMLCRKESQR